MESNASSTTVKDISSTTVKDMLKQPHTMMVIEVKWRFKNHAQLIEMLRHIANMVEEGHTESEYPEWKLILKP
jgi:hypothetical protein